MNTIESTSDKEVEVSIYPVNIEGKPIGTWDKNGSANWFTDSGSIAIVPNPDTGGILARIRCLQPTLKLTSIVTYSAMIRTDMSDPNAYVKLEGATAITFAPPGMATGLVATKVE